MAADFRLRLGRLSIRIVFVVFGVGRHRIASMAAPRVAFGNASESKIRTLQGPPLLQRLCKILRTRGLKATVASQQRAYGTLVHTHQAQHNGIHGTCRPGAFHHSQFSWMSTRAIPVQAALKPNTHSRVRTPNKLWAQVASNKNTATMASCPTSMPRLNASSASTMF